MNICDSNIFLPLLKKHGFHISKSKGQNFLTERWVAMELAEGAEIDKSCGVLEIGPGLGSLTQTLCESAARVVSVELDRFLVPILQETMEGYDNFTLISGDILQTDLHAVTEKYFPGLRPVVCANLPYQITSPVLSQLLKSRCFRSVTVMVQKEMAERICARPASKNYSAFSLLCQYYTAPEILFEVPPECFYPKPNVTSAVVSLRSQDAYEVPNEALFFQVVRSSFAQRRKTLANGLVSGFPALSKDAVIEAIRNAGFSESIRGEALDIPGFARVSEEIEKAIHSAGNSQWPVNSE